ncbi:hypothetical protein TUBRATIS_27180 [Tubulinosema ratisbonensis]|uniref:Uncharacterized protein n=1 Tax=Tubulinosema ratisbonensis TaxID=291195 RepID=A0A437AI86_9MICR|nr:hypothetical protein TUBRATIS_27180 [Tubulinosema ratisbonensis]
MIVLLLSQIFSLNVTQKTNSYILESELKQNQFHANYRYQTISSSPQISPNTAIESDSIKEDGEDGTLYEENDYENDMDLVCVLRKQQNFDLPSWVVLLNENILKEIKTDNSACMFGKKPSLKKIVKKLNFQFNMQTAFVHYLMNVLCKFSTSIFYQNRGFSLHLQYESDLSFIGLEILLRTYFDLVQSKDKRKLVFSDDFRRFISYLIPNYSIESHIFPDDNDLTTQPLPQSIHSFVSQIYFIYLNVNDILNHIKFKLIPKIGNVPVIFPHNQDYLILLVNFCKIYLKNSAYSEFFNLLSFASEFTGEPNKIEAITNICLMAVLFESFYRNYAKYYEDAIIEDGSSKLEIQPDTLTRDLSIINSSDPSKHKFLEIRDMPRNMILQTVYFSRMILTFGIYIKNIVIVDTGSMLTFLYIIYLKMNYKQNTLLITIAQQITETERYILNVCEHKVGILVQFLENIEELHQ